MAIIILVTVIVLILLNVSDSASSSALTLGPGDNSPCVNYSVLSDYWRMIGRRPLAPGVGYNCDIFLEVTDCNTFRQTVVLTSCVMSAWLVQIRGRGRDSVG